MKIKLANLNIFGSEKEKAENNAATEASARRNRHKIIHSIEARLSQKRTKSEKIADFLVNWVGSNISILCHFAVFVFWIAVNTKSIFNFEPFDPFPFIFLTMVVSLEAIFLSIFVLISQNRESKISDLREEIDIQINLIAEQEITKIINILAYLMKHLNVPYEKDPELRRMMRPLNTDEIESELERELSLKH